MTALQEAPDIADIIAGALQVSRGTAYDLMRTALAQQEADKPFQPDWVNYRQGVEDGKAEALLAQQGEQAKPAAYITDTEQGLMVWTPEMYGEACTYCDDGEFPVPLYTAAPAPQPAQDVPEVGFGNIPTKFLANGTRFKLSFDTLGRVSSLWNFMDELDGRWVALVAAEDDCHLQSAQPVVNQQMTTVKESLTHQSAQPVAPLTDDQIKSMWAQYCGYPGGILDFARAVREVK